MAAISISHRFRDTAGGRLALDGCLNDDGSHNCGDLPHAPLAYANAVTVSPDGLSIYVTSGSEAGTIAHFYRDGAGGQIHYGGCLANDGAEGCGDLPGAGPIFGARAMEVSPDGRSGVLVASSENAPLGSASVAHFSRTGTRGPDRLGRLLGE